ncbi:hypothetical protein GCM10028778_16050 [Barrientosiimonas marina]|uniref:MBL fold metallo-hydrolase n=1 Tax=Lentibacillus kimchii TaxID=1542911 RepID=A0ABW2UU00_9BACI
MYMEFLGTAGAFRTPRPGSNSKASLEARMKKGPFMRTGPGIFIHGPNVLFDTSEDIFYQLNRASISCVNACFYSHWHPDHTMGRRIFEVFNSEFLSDGKNTRVILPENVASDAKMRLGFWDHLNHMQEKGDISLEVLSNNESVKFDGCEVTAFPLSNDFAYGFILRTNKNKILIIPDESFGWWPSSTNFKDIDIAILPFGHTERHFTTGELNYPEGLIFERNEASFEDSIELANQINANVTYFTHIEEFENLSFEDCKKIENEFSGQNYKIAFDTFTIDI